MSKNKHQMNDVIYFINQMNIIKANIEEVIVHYTQKGTILKYIVRPYGFAIDNCVTIDEKQIYLTLKACKKVLLFRISETYTKENVTANYKSSMKIIKKNYKKDIKVFDESLAKSLANIKNLSEDFFEKKEQAYKDSLKEEKEND